MHRQCKSEFEKVNTMLVDMLLWALNTREPANFVVITKISKDTEYLMCGLLAVKERGSNVFLALPDTSVPTGLTGIKSLTRRNGVFLKLADYAPGYNEIRVWLCPKLLETIEKDEKVEDDEDEEDDPKDEDEEEEDEEVESRCEPLGVLKPIVFSLGSNSNDMKPSRMTTVLWDVEDYPLPRSFPLSVLFKSIKHSLKLKGCDGNLCIWDYVPDYLLEKYEIMAEKFRYFQDLSLTADRFCFVPKVPRDKYSRLNMMTLYLLLWAIDNPLRGPNLLVISKNMDAAKTFFYLFLTCLDARGFTVFLALPGAGDVAPKEALDLKVLPWEDLWSGRIRIYHKRKSIGQVGF